MRRRDFIRTGTVSGVLAGSGALAVAAHPLAALAAPGRRTADGDVRLNSNENPLGISPRAREALVEAITLANRYPSAQHGALVSKLAAAHEVADNQVVLGTGSAEVLQMVVQAFAAPRAKLVMADPTYEAVTNYQRTESYELIKVPLTSSYEHDLDRMREAAEGSGHPALVYLCNPNNPTATVTPSAAIDAWIADAPEHVFFLSDEAYIEYVEDDRMWSSLPWIEQKRNLVVVRTFSKIYGLAGLRLGYGIGHPDTIARLSDFASRNNVNQLAIAAADASFRDEGLMTKSREVNRQSREMVEATLDELGLERMPTQANFLMHRINGDLATYRNRMADAGFLVGRDFPPKLDWNRLSFGLPEDMGRFCDTLRDFRKKGWI
ncbi:MAG: aminotransferase class I/II-fold pyridoxal phosphate-dependent enzyme [Gemmatimonadetes bacterium]|nr:aminotransferase class I/II-fold pyridoxal phosphate-dependent enzyme [Gemmatimonadota bacterium]MDE2677819.1 aminotransferase class I/II-fold pyridoxal phosphate-dependent enzyme [Gemmatimonadota bacterium]MXX34341.1 aminotransferase class I/II-fold pyridoxal phosphate-dependent enzyme [Gemmatimonadota bacterium]MYA12050.1 aminotransferase class I/II-fold pyridoxal phosphate-dependent enzyme [Gemmatimonadota bacterium]MYD14700.1 aminotransferase class I/II-fold pyridoxal phosphate-dependent